MLSTLVYSMPYVIAPGTMHAVVGVMEVTRVAFRVLPVYCPCVTS